MEKKSGMAPMEKKPGMAPVEKKPGLKIKVSPLAAGLTLGVGAALVQAYFDVFPPVADGFCFICHPRDLVNWVSNALFGTEWAVSAMSSVYPVLTLVGVMLGAFVASLLAKEFKWRPARDRIKHFALGFVTVICGILLAACPIRIVLQSAYGDPLGIVGWVFVIVGVVTATLFLRWRATRATEKGGK